MNKSNLINILFLALIIVGCSRSDSRLEDTIPLNDPLMGFSISLHANVKYEITDQLGYFIPDSSGIPIWRIERYLKDTHEKYSSVARNKSRYNISRFSQEKNRGEYFILKGAPNYFCDAREIFIFESEDFLFEFSSRVEDDVPFHNVAKSFEPDEFFLDGIRSFYRSSSLEDQFSDKVKIDISELFELEKDKRQL